MSAVLVISACRSEPSPEETEPLGYETARLDLPNCPVAMPPVVDRDGRVREFVAKYIDADDLCAAVSGLKKWMESTPVPSPELRAGDWQRVRSIRVTRVDGPRNGSQPQAYMLTVEADVPERSRLVGVNLSRPSGDMKFFVVPREEP